MKIEVGELVPDRRLSVGPCMGEGVAARFPFPASICTSRPMSGPARVRGMHLAAGLRPPPTGELPCSMARGPSI